MSRLVSMLTPKERNCLDFALHLRQRALRRRLTSFRSVFWPRPLRNLAWSEVRWRRFLQGLCLTLIWPLFFLGGLLRYLWSLVSFPFRYYRTLVLPKGIRSPGEKTLLGMDNAFKPVLVLNERDYIECVDQWVEILFGAATAREKSLTVYLSSVSAERCAILGVDACESNDSGFRSEIRIAKQRLSRDLGHYLSPTRTQAARHSSLESLAS